MQAYAPTRTAAGQHASHPTPYMHSRQEGRPQPRYVHKLSNLTPVFQTAKHGPAPQWSIKMRAFQPSDAAAYPQSHWQADWSEDHGLHLTHDCWPAAAGGLAECWPLERWASTWPGDGTAPAHTPCIVSTPPCTECAACLGLMDVGFRAGKYMTSRAEWPAQTAVQAHSEYAHGAGRCSSHDCKTKHVSVSNVPPHALQQACDVLITP